MKTIFQTLTALSLTLLITSTATASIFGYPASSEYNRGAKLHNAKNYQAAYPLFKDAAAQGNPYALAQLGDYAVLGYGVADINYQQARKDFNKALQISSNFKPAYKGLCRLTSRQYYQSKKANYKTEALNYCKKSGNAGFALYNLGILVNNNKEAFNYFLKAAKLGNKLAMRRTGFFYAVGIGTAQNKQQAKHWFNQCVSKYQDKVCRDALAKLS